MSANVLRPRPYQREAVDAGLNALLGRGRPQRRRAATVLPTGAGKTVVLATAADEWIDAHPTDRVLVLAHRDELLTQAQSKFHDVAPGLRTGIVKANQNETLAKIIIGSVQTLRNENRCRMLRDVGLIIVDECHHATAASYRSILSYFGALDDPTTVARQQGRPARALGYTATMSRGDGAALGDIWEEIVYMRTIADMIGEGFLVRPRGERVFVPDLDMSTVRKTRGDYNEGDLGRALEGSLAPSAIAEALRKLAPDKPFISFAPTVASAMAIADALREARFSCETVWGDMPLSDRRRILQDFRDGRIQGLSNCGVLTEGTDLPMAEVCIIARKTLHAGLYIQMAGRVLRPYPGKDSALIIDVVGASERHSLIAPVELFGEDVKTEPAFCELCDLDMHTCPGCGASVKHGKVGCELCSPEEYEAAGRGLDDQEYVTGPIHHETVDLFHGSASMWMRTYAGVWFLPAGERYIAIVPGSRPGSYSVTAMHKSRRGTGRWIIEDVDDIGYAMAWAEREVQPAEHTLALKERDWRARKPTQKMRDFAGQLRLPIPEGATGGEVSALITRAIASGRIDRGLQVLGHA